MGFFRNVTAAAVMVASVAGVSQAQVAVSGNTKGCFDSYSCTATTTAGNGIAGVDFTGGNFNWTALTTPQTVSLGSISFNSTSCSGYSGLCVLNPATGIFKLESTFTAPTTSPSSGFFDAFVNGSFFIGNGGATVDFDNTPQMFAFNGGILSLAVTDGSVSHDSYSLHGSTYNITGTLSYTSTPEPSSMALLGTGLFGLVPMVRRRRRK